MQCEARTIVGAGGGKVLDTARAVAARSGITGRKLPDSCLERCPLQRTLRDLHRGRGFPGIPILSQEPRSGPGRYPGDRAGAAAVCWRPAWVMRWRPGSRPERASPDRCGTCAAAVRPQPRSALAELCYRTLLADGPAALQAVSAQAVTPALERLVEANTLLSGLGFESSGLAAAHAVHNGLTAAHRDPCVISTVKRSPSACWSNWSSKGLLRATVERGAGVFSRGRTADHPGRHRSERPDPRPARPDRLSRHRTRRDHPQRAVRGHSRNGLPTPSWPPMHWDGRGGDTMNPDRPDIPALAAHLTAGCSSISVAILRSIAPATFVALAENVTSPLIRILPLLSTT